MSSFKARQQRNDVPTSARWSRSSRSNGLGTVRPTILLLAKTLFIPIASAAPLSLFKRTLTTFEDDVNSLKTPEDPNLWAYLGVAVALVLLGGAFAGLTIALMGQDETYLQVIATSGEGSERRHAEKVLGLLNKGKHWVLVTLLLSNVITNETLPIVLDRSLGGGWPAVLGSTVLIVIFGEIAPQSVCVRYGLSIGSFMAPFVLALMWLLAPVAWPTAKLLDWLLGEDHGTMYKKAGLKTLVQLHKTLGTAAGERLMEDEVTIINSVLDLKDKPIGTIMTPMGDVFTMSADTVLDERMMDTILSQGYSRIPIYAPDNSRNFIGMLLVKMLITYDPEDAVRVRDFSLATLPETAPFTSCLDIINFFQEGKSHMVLVSDFPGEDKGALGVVTLEDVIEELIGEEIIDESDVFVDVHKAIRRMAPAPKQRFTRQQAPEPTQTNESYFEPKEDEPLLSPYEDSDTAPVSRKQSLNTNGGPPGTTFLMRRKSSAASADVPPGGKDRMVPMRTNTSEMAEIKANLKHLGPSNAASRPRATRFTTVKIKPGAGTMGTIGTIPENQQTTTGIGGTGSLMNVGPDIGAVGGARNLMRSKSVEAAPSANIISESSPDGDREGLLKSAGRDASGGAAALRAGYGTMTGSPPSQRARGQSASEMSPWEASKVAEQKAREGGPTNGSSSQQDPPQTPKDSESRDFSSSNQNGDRDTPELPEKMVVGPTATTGEEDDELGDLNASHSPSRTRSQSRRQVRSGSITETTVDIGGMKKVVLEMTSSSSGEEDEEGEVKGKGKKGRGESKDC